MPSPIRSAKNLAAARGQPCQLRFVGICQDGPDHETTVACHVHSSTFGMGMKADDFSIIDGCFACHAFLDVGWPGKISRTVLLEHIVRGLQETLRNRIERGVIALPRDTPKDRKPRQRLPKDQRAAIRGRSEWPKGRRLQSRNTLKREPAN